MTSVHKAPEQGVHGRHDSGYVVPNPKDAPRSPSPGQAPGFAGGASAPGENVKLNRPDQTPAVCTMAVYGKVCESEGRHFIPATDNLHSFCEPCTEIPRIGLIDRAQERKPLLKAIYWIHKDEAFRAPICLGNDFANTLEIPGWSARWHNDLRERRLQAWRENANNPDEHRCHAVGNNYTLCSKCTGIVRDQMDDEEFEVIFELTQHDPPIAAPRFRCALRDYAKDDPEKRSPPEPWYSWINEIEKHELLVDSAERHTEVHVPGKICRICVDYFGNEPGFDEFYDKYGNPKRNKYTRISNMASSIPTEHGQNSGD